MNLKQIENLNKEFQNSSPQEVISFFLSNYPEKIAFATSLGIEDQVITEMIVSINKSVKIFTLDTGRLFQETYDLIQKTNSRYKINIEIYFPDTKQVEEMVKEKGINLFYESIKNRKFCCHVRKIESLKRVLNKFDVWITGLRKEQSEIRANDKLIEWDKLNGLIKVNPLIKWTEKDVWNYIKEKNIPYNSLHNKGFKSIGCVPCTRAVEYSEDSRSGRWWWENDGHKECGLHKR
ncbi:MAG: phosphoadenylyl-sulfate reductase [Bacteroidales bacterium]|nr:phosphoadenylyl-sulfate reductase [Bacteroidales bacterium]MCK4639373.1 phosphoadenylyl-sulfate reductase [Bacteroidales bacterium]